jgi:O-antigen/teichoic acid export membrane protein
VEQASDSALQGITAAISRSRLMEPQPAYLMSRRTLLRTGFYLLGNIVQKGAFVLFLPILVVALTPGEFSRFGLLTSAMTLLTALLTVMAYSAPMRLYFDYGEKSAQDSFLISVLGVGLIGTLIGLVVFSAGLLFSGIDDPISRGDPTAIGMLAVAILFQSAMEFGFSFVRVKGQAGLFFAASLMRAVLLIGVFLATKRIIADGMTRVIFGFVVANLATSVLVILSSIRGARNLSFKWTYYRDAFHYSWPLLIHLMASWSLSQSGRWIGALYIPMDGLAPYILVVQICLGGMLIVRAIYDAKRPEIGIAFGSGDVGRGKAIIFTSMIQAMVMLTALFALLYAVLFWVDVPKLRSYLPTRGLLLTAMLACFFDALYSGGVQLLAGLKETKLIAACTVGAGLCTVVLSFPLAKSYGDMGLAVAMAAGLGLQALVTGAAGWRKLQRYGV